MNYNYFADEIKNRLTAADVLPFYGIQINSRGFANCPFHHEKTASMKVYNGKGGYHCFGCGANGDIITFVEEYFQISFKEAVKKLNDDFALGYPLDGKIDRRKQLELSRIAFERERERKAEQRQKERQQVEDAYWAAFDKWKRLDDNKRNYAPKSPTEPLHPLFVEALKNIDFAEYNLSCAEIARYEYENRNK